MIARFDSECNICIGDIDEGITEITHHSSEGWVHVECAEEFEEGGDGEMFSCAE